MLGPLRERARRDRFNKNNNKKNEKMKNNKKCARRRQCACPPAHTDTNIPTNHDSGAPARADRVRPALPGLRGAAGQAGAAGGGGRRRGDGHAECGGAGKVLDCGD